MEMQVERKILLSLILFVVTTVSCRSNEKAVYLADGIKIGEVTHNTAVIWSRATAVEKPDMTAPKFKYETGPHVIPKDYNPLPKGLTLEQMEGAVPGKAGKVRLILTDAEGKRTITEYKVAAAERDFTCQFVILGLKPRTQYGITAQVCPLESEAVTAEVSGCFRTASSPDEAVPVLCTSASDQSWRDRDDADGGFKVYKSMRELKPDFFVNSGDFVYYDRGGPYAANTALARHKWNRTCALPFLVDFYSNVPSYFTKDDHDTLRDDCYPGISPLGEFTFEQGVKVWYEQVPIESKPYRTFRWGKDLQIWLTEGREYRSANTMPDGPDKTILGREQKNWLVKTVTESDATFKLLFSPGPVVGPDRTKDKADNYSNKAFETEGDWLRKFLAGQKNMYVINGDRHWQYVSVDAETGLQEYGHGPASDSHAGGWKQEDKRPQHKFLRVKGGFIAAKIERRDGIPMITFTHYDVNGKAVNVDELRAK
jgi:alkaline phosphatase D